jgi:hypothetical protein
MRLAAADLRLLDAAREVGHLATASVLVTALVGTEQQKSG